MNIINTYFSPEYKAIKKYVEDRGQLFQNYNIDGISSENEYVPISAVKVNLGIYNGKVVHYSIPKSNNERTIFLKTYTRLYSALEYNTMPFAFSTKAMSKTLKGIKGILFEELSNSNVNILFLVAVKTEYMKLMLNGTLDMSKFAIFISKEFYTSVEYKSLHSKLQREMIIPLLELGVELIITNNIEEKCFKNNVIVPKFRSVVEMKEYLSSFNSAI